MCLSPPCFNKIRFISDSCWDTRVFFPHKSLLSCQICVFLPILLVSSKWRESFVARVACQYLSVLSRKYALLLITNLVTLTFFFYSYFLIFAACMWKTINNRIGFFCFVNIHAPNRITTADCWFLLLLPSFVCFLLDPQLSLLSNIIILVQILS